MYRPQNFHSTRLSKFFVLEIWSLLDSTEIAGEFFIFLELRWAWMKFHCRQCEPRAQNLLKTSVLSSSFIFIVHLNRQLRPQGSCIWRASRTKVPSSSMWSFPEFFASFLTFANHFFVQVFRFSVRTPFLTKRRFPALFSLFQNEFFPCCFHFPKDDLSFQPRPNLWRQHRH